MKFLTKNSIKLLSSTLVASAFTFSTLAHGASLEQKAVQMRNESRVLVTQVRHYEQGNLDKKVVKEQLKELRSILTAMETKLQMNKGSGSSAIKGWDGSFTIKNVSARTGSWSKRSRRSIPINTSQPIAGVELKAQTASYDSTTISDLVVEFANGKKLVVNGSVGRLNGSRSDSDMILKLADFDKPRKVKQVTFYTHRKLDWAEIRGKVPKSYIQ